MLKYVYILHVYVRTSTYVHIRLSCIFFIYVYNLKDTDRTSS